MVVTRESLAAGLHPRPVLDAMKILLEEPIPSMCTLEGMKETIKRQQAIVDNNTTVMTVADVMFKFNVKDCTDARDEYDKDEIDEMDTSLGALFDMLTKTPSTYKVSILPGSYNDEYPAINLDVFVSDIYRCDKRAVHIQRARAHLLKFCADEMLFAVYKKIGKEYTLSVYSWSDTELTKEDDQFILECCMNRWSPMNSAVTMDCFIFISCRNYL
jgi:hypothetical protein